MGNYKFEVKDHILTIVVDLKQSCGRSKSGKNILVATTSGNVGLDGQGHPEIKVGLNIFKPE